MHVCMYVVDSTSRLTKVVITLVAEGQLDRLCTSKTAVVGTDVYTHTYLHSCLFGSMGRLWTVVARRRLASLAGHSRCRRHRACAIAVETEKKTTKLVLIT